MLMDRAGKWKYSGLMSTPPGPRVRQVFHTYINQEPIPGPSKPAKPLSNIPHSVSNADFFSRIIFLGPDSLGSGTVRKEVIAEKCFEVFLVFF